MPPYNVPPSSLPAPGTQLQASEDVAGATRRDSARRNRNSAARTGLAAAVEGSRTGRDSVSGASSSAIAAAGAETRSAEDPCSLEEIVRVETVLPPINPEDIAGEEYVPPEYSTSIPGQIFLAPEDNLSRHVRAISRKKTLINQGIYFDLPAGDVNAAMMSTPYTSDASVSNMFARMLNNDGDKSLGVHGNMFPHFSPDSTSAVREQFNLYPGMAIYANNLGGAREVSEGRTSREAIDTLRFVLRRAWMRMKNGAAVFQDTTDYTAYETPFQFNLLTEHVDAGHSVSKLSLYPDQNFFKPGPPLSLADLHPNYTGKLSHYVLGPNHPDSESLSDLERDFNSQPLVPTGRKFLDIVHDVDMPFHEAEMEYVPPVRKLDVKFRVGSNFISDKYRRHSGSPLVLRDAYSAFRSEKDGVDYQKAPAVSKFTSQNVAEFSEVYEQQRARFPMYVHIDFTTHQGSPVAGHIRRSKYENEVLDLIQDSEAWQSTRSGRTVNMFAEVIDEFSSAPGRNRRSRSAPSAGDVAAQNQKRNSVDFLEWVNSNPEPVTDRERGYPLGVTPESGPSWMSIVRKVSLVSNIKQLSLPKVRGFEKIMKGERAYSETIAYKIEKYEVEGERERLVQTFLVMDSDETERISFLDTQVNYSAEYIYRIYAYNFVVGTEYEYTDVSHTSQDRERTGSQQSLYQYDSTLVTEYRAVYITADGERTYADDRSPVPEDRKNFIGTLPVTHRIPATQAERHAHKETWLQAARENREPTAPNTESRVKWTVEVRHATLRGANPTEEEVRREWESRQSDALGILGAMHRQILARALDASQSDPGEGTSPNPAQGFGAGPAGNSINPFFVDVEVAPKIMLVEVPFFEKSVPMVDAPPVFPNIHFVPFKGDRETVRINITSNSGEYMMNPIMLEPEDSATFEKVRQAQGINMHEDGKIKFKSDDLPSSYEVYRMDTPPESITDFSGNYHTSVLSSGSGATYDDSISPNKKYYYTFRSVDASGAKSNPTHVYACMIVSTDEGMYLDVHVHRMHSRKKNKTRALNRALYISAADIQKVFQLGEDLPSAGDESLGPAPDGPPEIGHFEKSIWNKRFKIRVESKKTGKKVDINIKFKKKVAQSETVATSTPIRGLGVPDPEEPNGPLPDDGSPTDNGIPRRGE